MSEFKDSMSISKVGRISGALYLVMMPFAFFSLHVRYNLVIEENLLATANNIISNELLFRGSVVSWLISQVIFIFLVFSLYKLLNAVNKNVAKVMAILALISVPISFMNELNRLQALLMLTDGDLMALFSEAQIQGLVLQFIKVYDYGNVLTSVFWGLWLFPLGYLIAQSSYLPKLLGILLMIACVGYLIDFLIYMLFPSNVIGLTKFTAIGEGLFPLWLLIKSVNTEQWEKFKAGQKLQYYPQA